jgi:hypothetical protein
MQIKPRTQKAKGIILCLDQMIKDHPLNSFFARVEHVLISEKDQIKHNVYLPSFARPCPKKPRHGFIDSVTVKNNTELKDLWKKVELADKYGEIVLGPHLSDVLYNAVYTSGGTLSIGKGNDGATAGKNSISFPVAPHVFPRSLTRKAGLSSTDTAFIESVYPKGWDRWVLTQVRGGPAIDASSLDYIPRRTNVRVVIKPNNNLIEWEAQVKNFGPGTVVYGPGHTLASHAAIHCVLNRIPFVTTFKPEVGKSIAPARRKKAKRKLNRHKFKSGVKAGLSLCSTVEQKDLRKILWYSLCVLHNWAFLKKSPHAEWLLGSASIMLAKVGAALALGEHRHLRTSNNSNLSRENVYLNAMHKPTKAFYKLPKVFKDFYDKKWETGFGGIPWATCTWYSNKLWKNIVHSYNKETSTIHKQEIIDIVSTMNRTINLAHNNGWWFNKISGREDMDFISENPGLGTLCASNIFIELYAKVEKINSLKRNFKKTEKVYSPCSKDKDGNLMWLKVNGAHRDIELRLKTEDGNSYNKIISLTDGELKALRRIYDKSKTKYDKSKTLHLKSGKFSLGGRVRDVRKVFKI